MIIVHGLLDRHEIKQRFSTSSVKSQAPPAEVNNFRELSGSERVGNHAGKGLEVGIALAYIFIELKVYVPY